MCFLEVYNFLFVVSDIINYICLRLKQNDGYKQVLWANKNTNVPLFIFVQQILLVISS